MKSIIITSVAFLCLLSAYGQATLEVDFSYALDWHATNICMPDDTLKTLIGSQGQLLDDFGGKKFFVHASGNGF